MTTYWVETFIWDAEDEKWRFNGELYLDIRNIAWFDWDEPGESKRWGAMIKMKIDRAGYHYYYYIKEEDAIYLNNRM